MASNDFDEIPNGSVEAVFFDMDGTLIDSEVIGATVISDWLRDAQLDPSKFDPDSMEGLTWADTEAAIKRQYSSVAHINIAHELAVRFDRYQVATPAPEIPGAIATVRRASQYLPVGLVTSSVRSSAHLLLGRFELKDVMQTVIAAQDVTETKPNPMPYLLAAQMLDVKPERCLVFEDSIPGVESAFRAGMTVIRVGSHPSSLPFPHAAIVDYFQIPKGFFKRIAMN